MLPVVTSKIILERSPRLCRTIFTIAVCCWGVATLVTEVSATTRSVPLDFQTIQGAINASVHGDTVLVAPGTYAGSGNRDIKFNGKRIVVRSEAGAEETIIDCGGTASEFHRGFDFNGTGETNQSILDGFTIQNGYVDGVEPLSRHGGGIRINDIHGGPLIQFCIIRNCFARNGSAIYCYSMETTIRSCQIKQNGLPGGKGRREPTAVHANRGADLTPAVDLNRVGTVTDCIVAENYGVGVTLRQGQLIGTTVQGNSVAGVYATSGCCVLIRDCLISGNFGHGIYLDNMFGAVIEGCTITGNKGPGGTAGGIEMLLSGVEQCQVSRSIVRGNCATDVRVGSGNDITFECCAIDPSRVGGTGSITYSGPQVVQDPMFCGPETCVAAPTIQGNYSLQPESPCRAENSPCGELIGAFSEACFPSSIPSGSAEDGSFFDSELIVGVFPNPALTNTSVQLSVTSRNRAPGTTTTLTGRLIEAALFDVNGREHLRQLLSLAGQQATLELGAMNSGTYFLRIRSGDDDGIGKVIVMP